MMKRNIFSACLVAGVLVVCGAQQGTMVGGEYVVSVPSGDVTLNADDVSALGTSTTLVKQGVGRLVIASDLVGWTGELRIEAGYVRAQHVGAMGYAVATATSGGVVVKSGGTLELDGSVIKSGTGTGVPYAKCQRYLVEGTGVDGTAGAVRLINASSYWTGGYIALILTGDVTFTADNTARQLDIRNMTYYDMNGHTVTIDGLRLCVCNGSGTVKNVGNYVVKNGGHFVSEQTNFGSGSKDKTISFESGTGIRLTRLRDGFNWFTLDFAGTSTWYTQSWSDGILSPLNIVNGPVILGGTATIQFQNSTAGLPYTTGTEHNTIELKGKVSGTGGFSVKDGWLLLSNPTNDFSGQTTVDGNEAHIIAKDWYALPSVTNGHLTVKNGGSVDIQLDPAKYPPSAQMDGEIASYFANRATMAPSGSLSLDILGTYTYTTPVEGAFGPVDLAGGTLVFSNCGMLWQDSKTYYVADTWPDIARVVVGVGTAFGNEVATPINVSSNMTANDLRYLIVGRTATRAVDNMRGILEVREGGIVTNRVNVAGGNASVGKVSTTASGALFIRNGGTVHNPYQSNASGWFGNYGHGYAEVEEGATWVMGNEWVRFGAHGGYGVFWQKGGTVTHQGQHITPGYAGGFGRLRFSGGTLTGRGMMLDCTLWDVDTKSGDAVCTVDGGSISLVDYCVMAANSGSTAILNLNGGVFRPVAIDKATNVWNSLSCNYTTITSNYGAAGVPYSNNRADVNFNGGTLRAYANNYCLFGSSGGGNTKPDRATVYAGGAVIDTDGKNVTLNMSLGAPSGKGITNVPFTCSTPWNYTGSPVVTIVGDGTGASAFAEFDSTNGTITGVVVTSPGNDYTTAKAIIARGGWTNTVEVPLTAYLSDNVLTGGLTKVGSGRLDVTSVNTYRGPTVVRAGTLRLGIDNAIDAASLLRVESGATADLNGKALSVSGLAGEGTVTGNLTVTGTWHVAAADLIAGRRPTVNGTVTLAPGTSIHVDDPEGLLQQGANQRTFRLFTATAVVGGPALAIDNLDVPWGAKVSGSTVLLGYTKGTMLLFR